MVRPERENQRDLTYSKWHRTLPNYCYMIDLDSIEWRQGKGIVAIIETCRLTTKVYGKTFQMKILRELAEKLEIPVYLVTYYGRNGDISLFEVYDLTENDWPDCPKKTMTPEQYKEFIKKLGDA